MRVSCPISWMRKHWSFSFKFSNWRNRVKHRNVPLSVCRPIEDVRLWIENFENTELCGTAVPYHSLYSAFLFPFLNRDGISIGGGKDSLIPWFSFLFLHDLFWFYLIPRLSFNPIQTVAPATGIAVAILQMDSVLENEAATPAGSVDCAGTSRSAHDRFSISHTRSGFPSSTVSA